jgi:branched-chain amino acid transport system ATP-binding protein
MTASALRGEGLRVHFEGVKAVDGVDIEVHRDEILGVIGPNGAGKTTLVNAMTGFQRLTAGRLFIDDKEITGTHPSRFSRLGIARTFQSLRSFGGLTVFENVEVAGAAVGLSRREARRRSTQFLQLVGLGALADRRASALSFGQERRLEIARAAALGPAFLVLDEPAAGLNDAETVELVSTIRRLRDELACGVLLIEHDMGLIMDLSTRIHVLNFGRTLAIGSPEEIQSDDAVLTAYLGHRAAA